MDGNGKIHLSSVFSSQDLRNKTRQFHFSQISIISYQTAMVLADGQADGTFLIDFSTKKAQPKTIFQYLPEK